MLSIPCDTTSASNGIVMYLSVSPETPCCSLKLLQIDIAVTSVTSLLANKRVALESEMCVNVHVMICVKVQP